VKGLRVSSLNVRSLRKHLDDVQTDPHLMQADLLCLLETWLTPDDETQERYQLDGYNSFFLSQGRGKGIVVYVRGGLRVQDAHHHNGTHLQMMKICLENLDIISIYRSSDEPFSSVVHYLQELLNNNKTTLLIGDVNYCFTQQNPLSRFLTQEKFEQLVTSPTHIKGGIIDHAHLRESDKKLTKVVKQKCHYWTDHNSVNMIIKNMK